MTTKQLGAALWIAIGIMLFIEQVFAVDETYDFTIVYLSGALYLYTHFLWSYTLSMISGFLSFFLLHFLYVS